MKQIIIALLTVFPLLASSQKDEASSKKIYENLPGLEVIDSITGDHIKGGFSFGNGRPSYVFRLDLNNTFKMDEGGCMAGITLNKGVWKIKNKGTLILKSKKQQLSFDVLKFDNFLFFILPEQRINFIKDFRSEWNEINKNDPTSYDSVYTPGSSIAFHLMKKYCCNELIH